MKTTFLMSLILISSQLIAQTELTGSKWLVILSGSKTRADALLEQAKFDTETTILYSSNFDNLNPGWFINCLTYETRDDAQIKSSAFTEKGINNYVKFSGAYKDTANTLAYLQKNHYLVYGEKYMLLNVSVPADSVKQVIGCDIAGAYIAKASIKKGAIPDYLKYLLNKEMIVYNEAGQTTTARVSGFIGVYIINPYWGFAMQWQQENRSETYIAREIIGNQSLMLAATLDLEDDFDGTFAHLSITDYFCDFAVTKDIGLERQALVKFKNTSAFRINDSLLHESIKNEEAYAGIEEADLKYTTIKTFASVQSKFVYINYIFGDYCEHQKYGGHYANLFALWDVTKGEFEIIERFEAEPYFEFAPIVYCEEDASLVGFTLSNFRTKSSYFRMPEWKNTHSLSIWAHECD